MSSRFTKIRTAFALLLAAFAFGACTEVQVQETRVLLDTSSARCGNNNNGSGPNNGGNQQPQMSGSAVMDTYIVQVFELYDPLNAGTSACNDCLAQHMNCFLETETCLCGDETSVAPAALPGMLANVRMSLPDTYGSLYCMRIMAVQRTSPAEEQHCQCDSSWETPDRTRLCAVSTPYAAGPAPVPMSVMCGGNQDFAACAVEPATTSASPAPTN